MGILWCKIWNFIHIIFLNCFKKGWSVRSNTVHYGSKVLWKDKNTTANYLLELITHMVPRCLRLTTWSRASYSKSFDKKLPNLKHSVPSNINILFQNVNSTAPRTVLQKLWDQSMEQPLIWEHLWSLQIDSSFNRSFPLLHRWGNNPIQSYTQSSLHIHDSLMFDL
jgi:hypothetical protein